MNYVYLIGRITKPFELKIRDKTNFTKFNLAVKRKKYPKTDFFIITAFGSTAKYLTKYATKSSTVAIVGYLDQSHYQVDQKNITSINIIATEVKVLSNYKQEEPKIDECEVQDTFDEHCDYDFTNMLMH